LRTRARSAQLSSSLRRYSFSNILRRPSSSIVMTDSTQHTFSHEALLAILLKSAGIHEGLWMLSINFGLSATNMSNSNNGEENLRPCVMAFVENFGLMRVERELKGLTLDAAIANPLPVQYPIKKSAPRKKAAVR
jgi:hypothetical protein